MTKKVRMALDGLTRAMAVALEKGVNYAMPPQGMHKQKPHTRMVMDAEHKKLKSKK